MRKVVKSFDETVTLLSDVSAGKYYGLIPNPNDETDKAFVVREQYESGDFIVLSLTELTNGNDYRRDSDLEFLLGCFSEIYEFDTAKELFKWLSE